MYGLLKALFLLLNYCLTLGILGMLWTPISSIINFLIYVLLIPIKLYGNVFFELPIKHLGYKKGLILGFGLSGFIILIIYFLYNLPYCILIITAIILYWITKDKEVRLKSIIMEDIEADYWLKNKEERMSYYLNKRKKWD